MAQYLSPRNDYGFKKLFGNKDHKDLTISFLNAILGRTKEDAIKSISFKETENIPLTADGRRSFLDVYCTDVQGRHFIIEMSSCADLYRFEPYFTAASADKQFKGLPRRIRRSLGEVGLS